jgi:LPS export ABC transporter protein LptC
VASEELQSIQADLVDYNMVSFLTHTGIRQGRVQADTAYLYGDSASLKLFGMHVVFYNDDGRDRADVVSESGELDQRSNRMVARGHVVLTIYADNRTIESAEINYDPDRNRIWSDSATVMRYADGRVSRGSSFESDLEFKNVQVKNPTGAVGGIVF